MKIFDTFLAIISAIGLLCLITSILIGVLEVTAKSVIENQKQLKEIRNITAKGFWYSMGVAVIGAIIYGILKLIF